MTGGGFGGSIVVMGRHAAMADAVVAIDDQYPQRTGLQASHFVTTAGAGAQVVKDLAL
jgi:galactokinase